MTSDRFVEQSFTREELAGQADVDQAFVDRLIEIGALGHGDGGQSFGPMDVRRVRLLRAWEEAGLRAEGIIDLVRKGDLSVAWLNTPVMTRARRLDTTFRDLLPRAGRPATVGRSDLRGDRLRATVSD